jgi:hypothetical protein
MHIQLMAYTAFGRLWINVARHDEASTGAFYTSILKTHVDLPAAAEDLDDAGLMWILSAELEKAAHQVP